MLVGVAPGPGRPSSGGGRVGMVGGDRALSFIGAWLLFRCLDS